MLMMKRMRAALLLSGLATVMAPARVFAAKINVYWGQNGATRLADVCADQSVDYVTLAFVNKSPEQGGGDYPGTNFGAHCPDGVFYSVGGQETSLISSCGGIIEDIPACHALGVKVLLSIGGVYSAQNNYAVSSVEAGEYFADFLWYAFGPHDPSWSGPRPFDASATVTNYVDGFDFDIEEKFADQTPWVAMIDRLREHFATAAGEFLITGAPECPLGNAFFRMKDTIAHAQFDVLWIQFYNNPSCDAVNSGFNFDAWVDWLSGTKSAHATLYIGLPAAPAAATTGGYLIPARLKTLLDEYASRPAFGGVMFWDSQFAADNLDGDGRDYVEVARSILSTATTLTPTATTTTTTAATGTPECVAIHTVQEGDYCYSIAETWHISVAQILASNPGLNAFCDLTPGQPLCLPAGATTSTSSSVAPTATAACTKTHTVFPGDTCSAIATAQGISLAKLLELNPQLDAECALFPGNVLCVSDLPQTATSTSAAPTETPACTQSYEVQPGDFCSKIAADHGLTYVQFIALNPGLEPINCPIFIGQTLCVSSSSATTSSPTPTPTAPPCGQTYKVVSGDFCSKIATDHGLTLQQFLNLNPTLDPVICPIFVDQVVCVSPSTTTATTTTTTSTAPPTATASCGKTHLVEAGEYCYLIATNAGIDLSTLLALNPSLNCDLLQIGQELCVASAGATTTSSLPPPPPTSTPTCTAEYIVLPGDFCIVVATLHDISLETLTSLNPGLNCGNLVIGQRLCVSNVVSTTTTTSAPTTSPTAECTAEHIVLPGDFCVTIAVLNGITVETLTLLNPGINCGNLILGQRLCLSRTPVSSTSTTSSAPTASPTAECTAQYIVLPGDFCVTIAVLNGITVETLITLNPGLNCGNLVIGQRLCLSNTPASSTTTTTAPTASPTACEETYIVLPGDFCITIAVLHGTTIEALTQLNPGLNCGNLVIGQRLCLPPSPTTSSTTTSAPTTTPTNGCTATYIVLPGDFCPLIAVLNGISLETLFALNPTISCPIPVIGQRLCVKSESTESSSSSSLSSTGSSSSSSMTTATSSSTSVETSSSTSSTTGASSSTDVVTDTHSSTNVVTETSSTSTTLETVTSTSSGTSTTANSTTESSSTSTTSEVSSSSNFSSTSSTTSPPSSSQTSSSITSTEGTTSTTPYTSSHASTLSISSSSLGSHTLITSTVRTTLIYTITSCPSTIVDCPGRIGSVTTVVKDLYTTVCPPEITQEQPVSPPFKTPKETVSTPPKAANSPVPKAYGNSQGLLEKSTDSAKDSIPSQTAPPKTPCSTSDDTDLSFATVTLAPVKLGGPKIDNGTAAVSPSGFVAEQGTGNCPGCAKAGAGQLSASRLSVLVAGLIGVVGIGLL